MSRPSPANRVVAFDLGGVVVDVDLSVLSALGERDALQAAFFGGHRHDRLTTGELDGEAFVREVAEALGRHLDDVATVWRSVVRFSPGGLELITRTAQRCPVVIWSNTDPLHWAVLGPALEAVAHDVAPSFRLGCQKPDRAFFTAALARLGEGTAPSSVLFVDDRADNVATATDSGITAVVVCGVDATAVAVDDFLAQPD